MLVSTFILYLALLLGFLFVGVVVDRRDKTQAYQSGSSALAVYLDAAQAVEALEDPSAVAAWYILSYLEGGELGPDRDTEEIKDEADVLVVTRVNRDEFVVANTAMQTDEQTIKLLTWLEDAANGVPGRYPLPTQDAARTQWWFFYNVNVRLENWRINTGAEGIRSRDFTILATKDENGDLYEVEELGSDQGAAEWDDFGTFKDTPA